jgi:hypothetical protein
MTALLRTAVLCVALLLLAAPARPHTSSTSYLDAGLVEGGAIALTWRVALRDLDALLDLDADGDGALTWGEVDDRRADIASLVRRALVLRSAGGAACPLTLAAPRWEARAEASLLALDMTAACPPAAAGVRLQYTLFDGIDPGHRLLVKQAGTSQLASVAPAGELALEVGAAGPASAPGVAAMSGDGVLHILGGADHLLFLVALMLPAVLERRGSRWVPQADLRAALLQVVWIATAFTAAHSVTLGLASFGLLRVPPSVIEPLIAATVLATALNNLWPVVTTRLAAAAFAFGLVHGFGFAEVLAPLSLPPMDLARALLGFNLGVEAGQLVIVAASFSLLAALRRWGGYPRWVLGGGSAALALLATAWLLERVFDLALLPV